MNSALLAFIVMLAFGLGYRFYSRFITYKILGLREDDQSQTPAKEFNDSIDYLPTKKEVLFGHHFSSIAGAAPIVGPAVAVIWGWLPAVLWIVFGVIFMGACHDLGALYLSMKHKGKSIGALAEDILGKQVKTMFLIVIFFLVWMVIAVFTLVISNLFMDFPGAVIPVNFEILIAVLMGIFINKKKGNLLIPSLLAQGMLFIMIILGSYLPISLSPVFGESTIYFWIVFLLSYCFIASTLPVWLLLQPRDYINSHQLMLCLGLLICGLFVTRPEIMAPAFNPSPKGAPPWFPFLFITIACGAISGFHGLVSSGTTSKQVKEWKDVRPIGYGSMLGEGLLALLATLAVCTGFSSQEHWHQHYATWESANGLSAKISAFVLGSSSFIQGVGIPGKISEIIIVVLIISFAATSLDSAARIQRYVISELGDHFKIKSLKNRYVSSFIAVFSAFLLMVGKGGGKGGLMIWPLFGATNQMLAGLTLVVICAYLIQKQKNVMPFLIPTIFVLLMTSIGLFINIDLFLTKSSWMLAGIGITLFACQIWIVIESVKQMRGKF